MNITPGRVGSDAPLRVAIIGSGISGLSAAWLLSKRHDVTLYEADTRLGGHSHTVDAGDVPVDTGFIVYNEATYPNLTALFAHLDVPTKTADMSFAVSAEGGRLEYSGHGLGGLFAQKRNLANPRFYSMLRDLLRFYRDAPRDPAAGGGLTLAEYLDAGRYGAAFREDHLFPMAAAIWSTPSARIGEYPAEAFIRFFVNHGLLQVRDRPLWRTVDGGSRAYVRRLLAAMPAQVRSGDPVTFVQRVGGQVAVGTADGAARWYDHVILATHADQALRLISHPTPDETRLLGAFSYTRNTAVLHSDAGLMPRRRSAWAAWNYLSEGRGADRRLSVTYWMNALQGLDPQRPLFVTLNPARPVREESILRTDTYEHPVFNLAALEAQKQLWSLQGRQGLWFCGAYFGAGFHEDGLQSGLAVAEALGGVRRPWSVAGESDRITIAIPVAAPEDIVSAPPALEMAQ
ncbi:MAG: FAD-dependent oxidoreductase [Pseudomonadota bacterium]